MFVLQSSKKTYVQLDCSQSVNCITSRESTVHVIEVAANSGSVSYTWEAPSPLILGESWDEAN